MVFTRSMVKSDKARKFKRIKTNHKREETTDEEEIDIPLSESEEEELLRDFIVQDQSDERGIDYYSDEEDQEETEIRSLISPSPRKTCVPLIPTFVHQSSVFQARLPEEIFDSKLELKKASKDFIEFFQMDRTEWKKSRYYKQLYESVVVPSVTMGSAAMGPANAEILDIISAGCLHLEDQQLVDCYGKCCACGQTNRIIHSKGYQCAPYDRTIQKIFSFGYYCSKKIELLVKLYTIINGLCILPVNEKMMDQAYTVLENIQERLLALVSKKDRSKQDPKEI